MSHYEVPCQGFDNARVPSSESLANASMPAFCTSIRKTIHVSSSLMPASALVRRMDSWTILGESGECLNAGFHASYRRTLMWHSRKVHRMPQCQLSASVSEITSCILLGKSSGCINASFLHQYSPANVSMPAFCASIQSEQYKPGKASRWGPRSAPQERPAHGMKDSAGVSDPRWLAGCATAQKGLEVLREVLGC